ncbi:MAG TPA: hypothetical protein VMV71_04490 [Candidatus Paceibacterota bacterium]|nr:hypothetical protein [Candidatus Paceibacterota bacterium]
MRRIIAVAVLAVIAVSISAFIAAISVQDQTPCEKLRGKDKQVCVKKFNSEKLDSAGPLSPANPTTIMRFD